MSNASIAVPEIEDECSTTTMDAINGVVEDKQKHAVEKTSEKWWFFRPVDGGMSHYTIMGEQPIPFDIMAQQLFVKDVTYESNGEEDGLPMSVSLSSPQDPLMWACNFGQIEFDILARSLLVWQENDVSYTVNASL